ncbi:MAG: dephospho-CoA kinase [Clostridia bacterium]|nr:dephospho-CoA kinase [Clostridia bacterium]
MIKIVGITGPSGSGKSLLSKYISDAGIPCINADEVYHSLLTPPSPCIDAIAKVFGGRVIAPDGSLDRPALSSIVFGDKKDLALLNETVLPIVIAKIKELISELESLSHTVVVVDAPTLIESGFHKECDLVVSVIASTTSRLERIKARDGISGDLASARLSAQKDDSFYAEHSDLVILNDSSKEHFQMAAEALIEKIKAF